MSKLSVEALNERRLRAVKLRLGGMKWKDIGEQVGLSRMTMIGTMKAFESGGWAAVPVGPRGRQIGDGRTLSAEQEIRIQGLIRDLMPDQLKLPHGLWTRGAVRELIRHECGIEVPVRTIGDYLKRWGFTLQKPIPKAYEQRPEAVKAWLEDEYPAIRERAKADRAEIHWGDETGLRSDDVRGRSYAPRGQTPVQRWPARPESLSLISTVTNQSTVRWMVFAQALNAETFIKFLKGLVKGSPRKVFLILDNLRGHHAKVVGAWLAEHREHIEVFYLPSDSPELDPDERLKGDIEQAVTSRAPKGHGTAVPSPQLQARHPVPPFHWQLGRFPFVHPGGFEGRRQPVAGHEGWGVGVGGGDVEEVGLAGGELVDQGREQALGEFRGVGEEGADPIARLARSRHAVPAETAVVGEAEADRAR